MAKLGKPQGKDRVLVALDTKSTNQALKWVRQLSGKVGGFKLGFEYFYGLLWRMIGTNHDVAVAEFDMARDLFGLIGSDILADIKIYDIPNTMGGAASALNLLPPRFMNLHASAGIDGMMAVVENKGNSLVLAVTLLTSFEENNANLLYGSPTKAKVLQLARDAKLAGCDGIICSPLELPILKARRELAGLIYVTPGIRPLGADKGDQNRVMTPGECVLAGGDYMVIGRPITGAKDPANAVFQITAEIEAAEAELAAKAVK